MSTWSLSHPSNQCVLVPMVPSSFPWEVSPYSHIRILTFCLASKFILFRLSTSNSIPATHITVNLPYHSPQAEYFAQINLILSLGEFGFAQGHTVSRAGIWTQGIWGQNHMLKASAPGRTSLPVSPGSPSWIKYLSRISCHSFCFWGMET